MGKAKLSNNSCPNRSSFSELINSLLKTANESCGKIMLEKIPFCFIDKKYYQNIIFQKSKESDNYFYLMPTKIYHMAKDRYFKAENCRYCKYFKHCEGVYPSVPQTWKSLTPINK